MIALPKKRKDPRKLYQEALAESSSPCFFTIDPGARENGGTGLAHFAISGSEVNIYSALFESKEKSYDQRVNEITYFIYEILKERKNDVIFIEKPKFFDSGKGYAAAKSDSLAKLIYLYGRIFQAGIMCRKANVNVVALEIAHWKGQLSKAQTKRRVMKARPALDYANISGDEIDAIGMGLYILGEI